MEIAEVRQVDARRNPGSGFAWRGVAPGTRSGQRRRRAQRLTEGEVLGIVAKARPLRVFDQAVGVAEAEGDGGLQRAERGFAVAASGVGAGLLIRRGGRLWPHPRADLEIGEGRVEASVATPLASREERRDV